MIRAPTNPSFLATNKVMHLILDGFSGFIAFWGKLLLKKEKGRKRQVLTILSTSSLLCCRISKCLVAPELLQGPDLLPGKCFHPCWEL